MAENTAIDATHDDDLGDEALDRSVGGKFRCARCWVRNPLGRAEPMSGR